MNSQPNAMTDSFRATQVAAPAVISPLRRFYWSLRRELWESRSIYIAPLVVAGLSLLGFGIGLPFHFHATSQAQKYDAMAQAYLFVGFLLMGTNFVVAVFYCLDALHGERRDRSILFWKSLPVSDVTAVLAKASIPIVILPLIAFAATVATQFVMLLMNSALLAGRGMAVAPLWAHVSLVQMSLALFYHLLVVHGFWYAPFYGWLLLVSAWARRMVFLWAALPLVAIGVVEKLAFNTSYFAHLLLIRFAGGGD